MKGSDSGPFLLRSPSLSAFWSHQLLLINLLKRPSLTGAQKIKKQHVKPPMEFMKSTYERLKRLWLKTNIKCSYTGLRTKKAKSSYILLIIHFKLYLFLFQFIKDIDHHFRVSVHLLAYISRPQVIQKFLGILLNYRA